MTAAQRAMATAMIYPTAERGGARNTKTFNFASCARIDECQEWADKAETLASYAKMANHDALMMMATRIHRASGGQANC
jgi:hypothetical protein